VCNAVYFEYWHMPNVLCIPRTAFLHLSLGVLRNIDPGLEFAYLLLDGRSKKHGRPSYNEEKCRLSFIFIFVPYPALARENIRPNIPLLWRAGKRLIYQLAIHECTTSLPGKAIRARVRMTTELDCREFSVFKPG
jgi:hypothetical protein